MLPKHPFRCLSQGRSSQKIEHPSRLEGASIFCELYITCLLGQISAIRKCGPSSLAHVVLCISADLLCYLLRMLPKHPFRCLSQGRSSQKIEHPSGLEGASIFCEFYITCLLGQISAIRKCGPSSLAHVVLCISADLLCDFL